ncbi:cytoskeleton-associated protein 5-like [Hydra vulgaris]|uniref:Cytoskeleton-associated protein 5-like n=1 Tax=Hydra vulgaris TaxID=6087 RepID=A0ABM4C998_HYDVU
MDVCQPSPKVLKDIAVQIADRDNGVWSVTLNCIVEAYSIVGEKVYKLIGKRTSNKKEAPPKQLPNVKPRQPLKSPEDSSDSTEAIVQVKQELNLVKAPVTARAIIPPSPQIKCEFELDLRSIEGDERPTAKANTFSAKDVGELLDLTIAKISSYDVQAAIESLVQLEDVFRKKKTDNEIIKRVDQMKMLFSRHAQNPKDNTEEHEKLLKLLLSGMLLLFDAQCYAGVVSYNVLKDAILYFITVLNDKL